MYENSSLIFFNHPEGYIEPDGSGGYDYIYQYKDHLGNIRLSYSDDNGNGSIASSEIREENNYYPFGLKHKGYNGGQIGRNHKYGFGGKEEQDDAVGSSSLNWLDFGARNYDAALGRWMNLDPLAELMRRHSPYNYAFDNPVFFIDYDGMAPRWYGQTSNEAVDYANTVNEDDEARQSIYDAINDATQDNGGTESDNTDSTTEEESDCDNPECYENYFAQKADETQESIDQLSSNSGSRVSPVSSADEVSDPLGLTWKTPVGLGLIAAGQPWLPKRFITPGSSPGTSLASKFLNKIPGTSPFRLPSPVVNSSGARWVWTKGIGKFAGRWVPWVGWGLTVWDIGKYLSESAERTIQTEYGGDRDAYNRDLQRISRTAAHVCFVEGTKIRMGDGSNKNIEDIEVGDVVKTYNIELKKVENNVVLMKDSPIHRDLINIKWENGTENTNTMDHPYYVKGKGWSSYNPSDTRQRYGLDVQQMEIGDTCYFLSNNGNVLTEVKIVNVILESKEERTYNLSKVDKNNNFFANGFLVHNKIGNN